MQEHPNMLLKTGSFLILIGGLVTGLFTCVNLIATILMFTGTSPEMMSNLNERFLYESGGAVGSQEVLGFALGFSSVFLVIFIIMTVIDVVVGIMGLSRSKRPEKYRFFLVWGIILLIIGLPGTLMSGIFTLRGLGSLACGVAGPILYLVGSAQQNKIANTMPS